MGRDFFDVAVDVVSRVILLNASDCSVFGSFLLSVHQCSKDCFLYIIFFLLQNTLTLEQAFGRTSPVGKWVADFILDKIRLNWLTRRNEPRLLDMTLVTLMAAFHER